MENLSLMLLLSMIIPMTMTIFVFEKRTRTNLLFLMLGIITCFFCGELNGLLYNALSIELREFTVNITPITEEFAKAYPIFLYTFFLKPEEKKIHESSIIIGIGFSILENAYLLAQNIGSVSLGLALIRGFGSGMMHGISTFAVGYGISFIYKEKKLRIPGSLAMMCLAISYHSIYNNFVQSPYRMIGFLMPIVTFIAIVILMKMKKANTKKLNPEAKEV